MNAISVLIDIAAAYSPSPGFSSWTRTLDHEIASQVFYHCTTAIGQRILKTWQRIFPVRLSLSVFFPILGLPSFFQWV